MSILRYFSRKTTPPGSPSPSVESEPVDIVPAFDESTGTDHAEIASVIRTPTPTGSLIAPTPSVSSVISPSVESPRTNLPIRTAGFSNLPHQPRKFTFPFRDFGKKTVVKRKFQPEWFEKYRWLHYDESTDTVFCIVCQNAKFLNRLSSSSKAEPTFITRGFCNWKEAQSVFREHESSKCHREAVERVITLPATTRDIGESLSEVHAEEKAENRSMIKKIFENVRFLGRQGIAFRGNSSTEDSGNFLQLLVLRGCDDPSVLHWLEKKSQKYVSHDIQNEIIHVLSRQIIDSIMTSIHNTPFFCVMIDELADVSNLEQVVLVFRWVGEDFVVHEDFFGVYEVENILADTLVKVILDVLCRMNLSIEKCRGQCYDGASNMSGKKSGVAAKLQDMEPRALYTHCYGHSLNLACNDAIKHVKVTNDSLEITNEICKLVKYSPRREALFQKLKSGLQPDTPGLRVLCPTRWTVRANSLGSILSNYVVLNSLWDEALLYVKETDVKARIVGVQTQMQKFDFFWGISLSHLVLKHGDNLSKTLQNPNLSASAGQEIATLTVKTLRKIRNDRDFDLFYQKVVSHAHSLELDEPKLPRKRKMPVRFELGEATAHFAQTPRNIHRQQYFDVLDRIINAIEDRFDQPGFKQYRNLQDLLLNACNGKDYTQQLDAITAFYKSDVDRDRLVTQLETLSVKFAEGSESPVELKSLISTFSVMSSPERAYFSEVCTVIRLILVMPATNATSERSFSALRRLKTYLRSTMTQSRLNDLLILHVHKDHTDNIDIKKAVNRFVELSDHRQSIFGKF